jgi:excisionase family DNA binding protein
MLRLSENPAGRQAFFTPQEISDMLRISVYTVRRWIKEGSLPAYKVGRGWRISHVDLERWLNRQRPTAIDGDRSGDLAERDASNRE